MSLFRPKRISTAFLSIIIPAMALVTILQITFGGYSVYKTDRQHLREKLGQLEQNYADILSSPLWNVDDKKIELVLRAIQFDKDIVGTAVFNEGFSLFGSTGNLEDISYDDISELFSQINQTGHDSFWHLLHHLWHADETTHRLKYLLIGRKDLFFQTDTGHEGIGFLYIVLSEKNIISKFTSTLYKEATSAIVVTVLLVIIIMTIYSLTTTIPLKKLQKVMHAIQEGRYQIKVDWQSNNEIGQAITVFNELQAQQFQYQKEIATARDNLEERVRQRTEELRLEIIEREQAEKEKGKLEVQLRQAFKMEAIGTMAGGIAHDFNNILAIILGNAEMANYNIPKDNAGRFNIEQILAASERARDLVKQILTFSRQSEQKLLPIQPCTVIKESLLLLRSTVPTTVSMMQNICTDSCTIMADPTQLHQMFMNLLSNAVHAMEEKGSLEVDVGIVEFGADDVKFQRGMKPGEYLEIKVSDTGTGMDQETIERIFDPFYTTKELDKGTGMGLSIVLGIVKSHKGFVEVDSKPGEGSKFTIHLPVMGDGQDQRVEETAKDYPNGNERILFVDDEEMLAKVGSSMLEMIGYEVTVKTSSIDAMETFRSDPAAFDLVITDQAMPNMSGAEMAVELLKTREDIPIILCTGFSNKISEEKAKEIGIKKFYLKPWNMKKLAHAVREVLEKNDVSIS